MALGITIEKCQEKPIYIFFSSKVAVETFLLWFSNAISDIEYSYAFLR